MIIDNNNNPWFKAKDIADILEYIDTSQTIRKNIDEDEKLPYYKISKGGVSQTGMINIKPHTIFINESGLYSLIFNSKKEDAKKFKKWVTSEVLPSIRKTGEYKLKQQLYEKTEKIEDLNNKIEIMKSDVVPRTQNSKLINYFILIKLNDNQCQFTYYVIRCQVAYLKTALNKVKLKHQNCEELLRLYDPNSINFYNRIKEEFISELKFHGNYFRLHDLKYNEEELLKDIKTKYELRY